MRKVKILGPIRIPIKKVYIADEWPESDSLQLYRNAIRLDRSFPPILVAPPKRKGGRFRIVDGKHRLEACRKEKATHILAVVEDRR